MNPISPNDYPHLFRPEVWSWGPTHAIFEAHDAPPPEHLISNVNIVPHVGDQWVILRLEDGSWEIPGGTLEANEHYRDALCRELLEEAGAALVNSSPLGAWRCHNEGERSYKPHLPYPDSYRYVVYGEVNLIGKPLNPPDGEKVVSVECVPLEEAVRRFLSNGRHNLAELYQLAADVRQARTMPKPRQFGLHHLHGISRMTLEHFDALGITSLDEIAAMTPQQLIRFKGIGKVKSVRIRAHAEALLTGQAVWHAPVPETCRLPGLMLDIETEYDPGKPWSFGIQKPGEPVRILMLAPHLPSGTAPLPDGNEMLLVKDVAAAWQIIADEAATLPGPIYHWSKYEVGVLRQSAPPELIELLEPRLHDLLETYHHTVTMPVTSFSIKSIGAHLGQRWPDGEDAFAAWMAYLRWREKNDHALLVKPCAYLRADVNGLMLAWQWISESHPSR